MRRCHKKIGKTTTATAENFRLGKQFPSRRPATISPAERCRGGKTLFLLLYEKKKERPTFYYVGKFTVRLAASNRCAVNKPLTFLPSVLSSVPPILFTLHAISYNNYHHRSFNILQTIIICARVSFTILVNPSRGIDGKKEGKAKGKPSRSSRKNFRQASS